MRENFSWCKFFSYREEIRSTYPSVYSLKIKKKLFDIILEELKSGIKILDVGAYNKSLGEKIISKVPSITYKSMDIDRAQPHDYYNIEETKESFDMIILSEVIEHLEFSQGISLLIRLRELLKSNGKLVVSTPNLHHPNRYWDSDHKTPYRYDEIGAALNLVGLEVRKIYRIYNDLFFKRLFRLYIMAPLHSYFDIDFAKSIVLVAVNT